MVITWEISGLVVSNDQKEEEAYLAIKPFVVYLQCFVMKNATLLRT
jgi:hypothetical protein